jgi:MiaB-like tRNA modifying enzyme
MNIFIEVIGCTANQSDACIARYLINQSNEFVIVNRIDDADIILLFSCTVISSTEQRMLSKIREYHDQKKLIVTGCMASIQKEIIQEIDENIICIPPDQIHHLISYLGNSEDQLTIQYKHQSPKNYDSLIAPIAISEGCDFSCTYCITTYARGNLKSYPINDIKKDVKYALQQGCKELQLTAQDTASYGRDIDSSLVELIVELTTFQGWYRFRIGMMNPATVLPQLDSLIDVFKHEHIYKFLHLPIQSGDDQLLHQMGRKYTTHDVMNIIKKFRQQIPHITVATDVIVGFPGEKEQQHQKTIEFLNKMHPDIVNITKFSSRPFTKAKTMSYKIPTDMVKKRSKELTTITARLSLEKNIRHIGNRYSVLITEKGKNKSMIGRTMDYKPVVLIDSVSIGDIVEVEITDAKQTYLFGMLK